MSCDEPPGRSSALRLVPEVRGEPALGLGERHSLAPSVVGDLFAAEAAVIEPDHGFLFLAAEGEPIAPKTLSL